MDNGILNLAINYPLGKVSMFLNLCQTVQIIYKFFLIILHALVYFTLPVNNKLGYSGRVLHYMKYLYRAYFCIKSIGYTGKKKIQKYTHVNSYSTFSNNNEKLILY